MWSALTLVLGLVSNVFGRIMAARDAGKASFRDHFRYQNDVRSRQSAWLYNLHAQQKEEKTDGKAHDRRD